MGMGGYQSVFKNMFSKGGDIGLAEQSTYKELPKGFERMFPTFGGVRLMAEGSEESGDGSGDLILQRPLNMPNQDFYNQLKDEHGVEIADWWKKFEEGKYAMGPTAATPTGPEIGAPVKQTKSFRSGGTAYSDPTMGLLKPAKEEDKVSVLKNLLGG